MLARDMESFDSIYFAVGMTNVTGGSNSNVKFSGVFIFQQGTWMIRIEQISEISHKKFKRNTSI